jgi:outer membrane protein W
VDSYFGAGLAYVTVSDYTPAGSSESISVDSELTWTVQYGMDIALGRKQRLSAKKKRWSLGFSVSYMQGEAEAGSLSLPLETVNISAGVVWQLR